MNIEATTLRKITLRILPILFISYIVAYLDRVNVAFAAIKMNADLGLSAAAYGFGAGVFFLSYVLFEIPSNVILEKVGARKWIARIMFTWGLCAGAMAFISGEMSFYVVRALLGAAEAGFFPGVIFFLSRWFPEDYRGRIGSYFMVAIPLSTVIGAPISGLLLNLDGLGGFKGWQWLFILEALPALIMAFVVYFWLPDEIEDAKWLEPEERNWLATRIRTELKRVATLGHHSVWQALRNPRVLLLGLVCFGAVITNYGVSFFLPQIVKSFGGLSNIQIGLVSALPYVVGAIGVIIWGRHSDRTGERRFHTAIPIAVAASCVAVSVLLDDPTLKMIALSIAGFGMFGYLPSFWSLPATFLSGPALAAGIAAINSIANIAGFSGPYIIGYAREATGSFAGGLLTVAAIGGIAMLIILTMRLDLPASATSMRKQATG